jgi:hypothetical protein
MKVYVAIKSLYYGTKFILGVFETKERAMLTLDDQAESDEWEEYRLSPDGDSYNGISASLYYEEHEVEA